MLWKWNIDIIDYEMNKNIIIIIFIIIIIMY